MAAKKRGNLTPPQSPPRAHARARGNQDIPNQLHPPAAANDPPFLADDIPRHAPDDNLNAPRDPNLDAIIPLNAGPINAPQNPCINAIVPLIAHDDPPLIAIEDPLIATQNRIIPPIAAVDPPRILANVPHNAADDLPPNVAINRHPIGPNDGRHLIPVARQDNIGPYLFLDAIYKENQESNNLYEKVGKSAARATYAEDLHSKHLLIAEQRGFEEVQKFGVTYDVAVATGKINVSPANGHQEMLTTLRDLQESFQTQITQNEAQITQNHETFTALQRQITQNEAQNTQNQANFDALDRSFQAFMTYMQQIPRHVNNGPQNDVLPIDAPPNVVPIPPVPNDAPPNGDPPNDG
jgi:hypothetical protein